MLICIDPGHGGSDNGATYFDLKEKNINLKIAKILKELLLNADYDVIMTRENDENVSLQTRCDIANNNNADVFVSIHNNAHDDKNIYGCMTLHYPNSIKGIELAQMVQEGMYNYIYSKDLGLVPRDNLKVLKSTHMPAVLTESAFMSNIKENIYLKCEIFLLNIAEGIFEGISNFLA